MIGHTAPPQDGVEDVTTRKFPGKTQQNLSINCISSKKNYGKIYE